MDNPRGSGPWFVALLWNTSNAQKKQTEIVIHTYPHLFTHSLNAKDSHSFWVVLMKIGPFEQWSKGVLFSTQWSQKLRNYLARIERGITLYHASDQPLTLWIQTKDKDAIRQEYLTRKKEKVFHDSLSIYALKELLLSK